MSWTRSAARAVRTCAPARASPVERDAVRGHPPERAPVRALERVERRGVHLDHVVGGLDRAPQADDHAHAAHRGRGGDPHRVAKVGRPVEPGIVGRAHRPGHHDRLGTVEHEVPAEGGLLDRVRALDDDRAIDRRIRQRRAHDIRDIEEIGEREVTGRGPAAIDRHHVGHAIQPGRSGQDGRAIEDRHVATGDRIERRADRPAREHDRDAPHRAQSRSVGSDGPAWPGTSGPSSAA